MSSPEFPAMPFYVRDWLSGDATRRMSPEQRGAFADLLAHAWQNPGCTLPDDDEALASLSGLGMKRWKQIGAFIRQQFQPAGEGRIRNPKSHAVFLEMLAHREGRSRAGQKGAATRWREHDNANGKAMATAKQSDSKPVAKTWPASSSASLRTTTTAAAGSCTSSPEEQRAQEVNDAAAAAIWPIADDQQRWAPPDRVRLRKLHQAVGAEAWPEWREHIDELIANGFERDELRDALKDFVANAQLKLPKLSVFRGYVETAHERYAAKFEEREESERRNRAINAPPAKDPEPPPLTPEERAEAEAAIREYERWRESKSSAETEGHA